MVRNGAAKDKDKEFVKDKAHGREKPKERSLRKDRTDTDHAGPSTDRRSDRRNSEADKFERKHSARPTDELKLLQDSLSQFFTPSAGRRCRQPPRKFDESGVNSDESFQHQITDDSGCEKVEPVIEKAQRRKKSADYSIMVGNFTSDLKVL
ncbi:unnamed protein product [Strongylus vulgaris]|uniref:Uncharacterized protein n=1 Tax=Strongylus vulgaris TaxID=40348 RepID=A0A3P7LMT0_STRVU|nr:unnamed protein product [Strongylus vulgaris]